MSKDKTGWNRYRRGPVQTNSTEIVCTIDSLGTGGEGVARHDGQVVFVPFTLPGEQVKVKPLVRKKSFIRGQIVKIMKRSAHRLSPPCPHFEQCGGCDWQHVPYTMQLQAKTQHLSDALQRIGAQQQIPMQPMLPSNAEYHYRNRIQGVIRQGQFHFKQRGSDQLVAISQCAIAENAINDALANDIAAAPEGRVEIAVQNNNVSIVSLNDGHVNDTGFRQVNTYVSERLTTLIESIAKEHHGNRYIDLYCGRGHWSIDMAQSFPNGSIIGVDASEKNIRAARETAQQAGLSNVRFQHGRVEKLLKQLPLQDSFCIVDPPRAGLDEQVCQALCQHAPHKIAYISCHPASLARDLSLLTAQRFKLESVTPLDMFPQTAHIESVTVLSRVNEVDSLS